MTNINLIEKSIVEISAERWTDSDDGRLMIAPYSDQLAHALDAVNLKSIVQNGMILVASEDLNGLLF